MGSNRPRRRRICLVRALKTAGARHVLATLRRAGDASALEFMKRFYETRLSQPSAHSDPAKALRDTQAHCLKSASNNALFSAIAASAPCSNPHVSPITAVP
ncbi:MAG: CHAT domain-containing protein [Gammaproteobacteria bacterium]|nr:CHAT domain-containing protein [Gammaproteobacteria bacterium]